MATSSAPSSTDRLRHDPGRDHAHGHHAHGRDVGTLRLVLAIVFNGLITAVEFVAGLLAGSLALLADATHNLSDTASMATSLVARRVSTRAADDRRTFGYQRAELIGAFINLVTLVVIALYLLVHAVERFLDPQTIDGTLMIWVGASTLVGNVATALVLYQPSKGSLNIKSAFVHIVADALGSVAVVAGGVLVLWYDWTIVDPLLTAAIAGYILVHSAGMLRETVAILMESAPRNVDLDALTAAVESLDGVTDVHHVHVWRLDESRVALEAHVAVQGIDELAELDRLKQRIKTRLHERFGVDHATLEFEHGTCADVRTPDPGTPHSDRVVRDLDR